MVTGFTNFKGVNLNSSVCKFQVSDAFYNMIMPYTLCYNLTFKLHLQLIAP